MTLGFALVLALVYLTWLLDRVVFLVPAFALAIVLVGGLSLSGHDAVDAGSSWKTELADWVHISAASLWIGGLAAMVGLLWFGAPALRRPAFLHFSRLATVLIALVLVAGTYLSIVRLPHLHDLWTAGYGRVLLVKLGLVSVALLWGAFHQFVDRARARAGRFGLSLAHRPQPRRREPRRSRRAAGRCDPRRLEAAAAAGAGPCDPGGRAALI